MTRKLLGAAALLALGLGPQILSQDPAPNQPRESLSPYIDDSGAIRRPADYRKSWVHLGTYFVRGETADGDRLHAVYAERSAVDAYQGSGEWPDGAVLVKEVLHTAGAELTTGDARWAVEPDVWFVVVKDREGRFPDNPLWGDGWGWALFRADAPERQVATDYRQDCLGCHEPARETDLVYVQGYPLLGLRRPQRGGTPAMTASAEPVDFASGSAERGAVVFAGVCTLCHSLASGVRKRGPSLGRIAVDGKLPSGKEATPENLLRRINRGGGGMPPLAGRLSAQQKADVIAYLQAPR